jgi:hypothetical protein
MTSKNQAPLLIAAVVVVIICVIAVCVIATGLIGFNFLKRADSQAVPTLQSFATVEPPEVVIQDDDSPIDRGLPFFDDFSDPDPSWFTQSDEINIIEFARGGLRMFLDKPDYLTFTSVDLFVEDVVIDVDVQKIGGPNDNSFGVVCRQQGETYYYFEVTSDGYYKIARLVEDEYYEIVPWEETQVILPGNGLNHIQAACVGTTLSLKVNDTLLVEAQDNAILDGYIGLMVGTFDTPGVDILFDNFQATSP